VLNSTLAGIDVLSEWKSTIENVWRNVNG